MNYNDFFKFYFGSLDAKENEAQLPTLLFLYRKCKCNLYQSLV